MVNRKAMKCYLMVLMMCIYPLDKIHGQSTDTVRKRVVSVGEDVTLVCDVSSDVTVALVYWKKDGESVLTYNVQASRIEYSENPAKHKIFDSTSLLVNDASVDDAGFYRCEVLVTSGDSSTASGRNIELSVTVVTTDKPIGTPTPTGESVSDTPRAPGPTNSPLTTKAIINTGSRTVQIILPLLILVIIGIIIVIGLCWKKRGPPSKRWFGKAKYSIANKQDPESQGATEGGSKGVLPVEGETFAKEDETFPKEKQVFTAEEGTTSTAPPIELNISQKEVPPKTSPGEDETSSNFNLIDDTDYISDDIGMSGLCCAEVETAPEEESEKDEIDETDETINLKEVNENSQNTLNELDDGDDDSVHSFAKTVTDGCKLSLDDLCPEVDDPLVVQIVLEDFRSQDTEKLKGKLRSTVVKIVQNRSKTDFTRSPEYFSQSSPHPPQKVDMAPRLTQSLKKGATRTDPEGAFAECLIQRLDRFATARDKDICELIMTDPANQLTGDSKVDHTAATPSEQSAHETSILLNTSQKTWDEGKELECFCKQLKAKLQSVDSPNKKVKIRSKMTELILHHYKFIKETETDSSSGSGLGPECDQNYRLAVFWTDKISKLPCEAQRELTDEIMAEIVYPDSDDDDGEYGGSRGRTESDNDLTESQRLTSQ